MPRDCLAEPARATEIKPDLSKPSAEALSYALRNLREILGDHRWDFHHVGPKPLESHGGCGTAGCAYGVGLALWGAAADEAWADLPGAIFGVMSTAHYGGIPFSEITPFMVADAIDRYLAERS